MNHVSDELIGEAADALDVNVISQLKDGGQKAVRLVDANGTQAVMKVISVTSPDAESLRRARREVELLATINHPNVVRVTSELVELDKNGSGATWLEEYLDGQDLSELLFVGRWDWDEARKLGIEVAHGLGAAHARKVVHRDLSANNVRRLSDGTYKVMDFGFARYELRSGLTIAGQPGTPGFASPEHLNGYSGVPTAASDVFAVGILLFSALTGALPIACHDEAEYLRRLRSVTIPDLSTIRTDLDGKALAVIKRCLHPQPARRYLNGSALAKALEGTKA